MRRIGLVLVIFLGVGIVLVLVRQPRANQADLTSYEALETRLRPLALPAPPTRPGDWLATNVEHGQTFAEYLEARPVRRSRELSTIYVCEVGSFTPEQAKILATTYEYL